MGCRMEWLRDVLEEGEKRAPEFVRRANCEWLFRLAQSPKRLAKRYLVDGWQIFPIVLKERQALKRPRA